MGEKWVGGWKLIVHSLQVFKAYPNFLVPILAVWFAYAPAVLYLSHYYQWNSHSLIADLLVVFAFIFVLSFFILNSCAVVLDMIRQSEAGPPSLGKAIDNALGKNLWSIFLLSFAWAGIWFALSLIEAVLSKKRDDSYGEGPLTAQNAAAAIANYGDFSLSEAFIDALKKGVRMVVFLIMPGIVWENLGFYDATKKGLAILRAHLGDFGVGYTLTYTASAIIFVPPAIVLQLGLSSHGNPPLMHFPDSVWVGTILYMGVAWSFSIYLEQMFMAQLYLWHMKWQEKAAEAKSANRPIPNFADVEQPELLTKASGLLIPSAA